MIFTSTDCSTVRMVDITGFTIRCIGSPSAAISITPSPLMAEASTSEDAEVRELSAFGSGEGRRKGSLSRLISRSNEKSDDPIQNAIYVGP